MCVGVGAVACMGVGVDAGACVPGGAAMFMAGLVAGERWPSRWAPPIPAAAAVTAVTPPTAMNLRRSMVPVIVSSGGCPHDQAYHRQAYHRRAHHGQRHGEPADKP